MKRKKPALAVVKAKASNPENDALKARVAELEITLTQIMVKVANRDQMIASLKGEIAVMQQQMATEELRFRLGASQSAVLDPSTMTFVEQPKPAAKKKA